MVVIAIYLYELIQKNFNPIVIKKSKIKYFCCKMSKIFYTKSSFLKYLKNSSNYNVIIIINNQQTINILLTNNLHVNRWRIRKLLYFRAQKYNLELCRGVSYTVICILPLQFVANDLCLCDYVGCTSLHHQLNNSLKSSIVLQHLPDTHVNVICDLEKPYTISLRQALRSHMRPLRKAARRAYSDPQQMQ